MENRLRRWLSRLWAFITSADTWAWLLGFLPKPARDWLRRNIWGPFAAMLISIGIAIWGLLKSIDIWLVVVGSIVVFVASVLFLSWLQRSIAAFRLRSRAFVVEPISGSTSGYYFVPAGDPSPMEPQVLYARLWIDSKRFLRDCTVTVTDVFEVEPKARTLVRYAGEQRELYWTPGSNRIKKRDLTPGVPREADVAVLDQNAPNYFQVAAADDEARPKYPAGWYKVKIIIASESDDVAVQTFEGKIGLGTRKYPPPPLAFYEWKDGDEKRVKFD
jgi:hypothetical protein